MFALLFDTRLFLRLFLSQTFSLLYLYYSSPTTSTKLHSLAGEMKCILLKMNAEYTALLLAYELNLSDRVLFIWLWKWAQVKPAGITMLYCTWITLLDSVSLYLFHCHSVIVILSCVRTHTLHVKHRMGRQAWIRSFRSFRLLTLK